jgi:hypothetical protein
LIRREVQEAERFHNVHNCRLIYLCFINIETTEKMKTISIIFAAVLTLQVSALFGTNTRLKSGAGSPAAMSISVNSLAPETPLVASFEDGDELVPTLPAPFELAPVTPKEGSFEEMVIAPAINEAALAPTTPDEADFSDTDN